MLTQEQFDAVMRHCAAIGAILDAAHLGDVSQHEPAFMLHAFANWFADPAQYPDEWEEDDGADA